LKLIKEFELLHLSQEFSKPPKLTREITTSIINYDYETESGEYAWKKIRFFNTMAYRFTAPSAVPVEMVPAYDAIASVQNSKWIKEICGNLQTNSLQFKHYAIYFEDFGCYEFISTGFDPE